jgi:predicted 3-demethylubiquinone-9 3-methyltransferase (glyoxalase superfamily)
MAKNTICLWYDKDAEAAARFYAETFPDSAVGAIHRAPSDYPSGKKGDVLCWRLLYRPQRRSCVQT